MSNIKTFSEVSNDLFKKTSSPEIKLFISNIINEIISSRFSDSSMINRPFTLIKTYQYQFKQYYTYQQYKGSLCGFHSLFNIYYFIQYLVTNHKDFLLKIKNAWEFWSFYNETLHFLFKNLKLEQSAKNSLIKGGPLERFQFIFLLNNFPKIKNMFSNLSKQNYIISYTKFLYGFNLFNGTIEEAIDFQEKINEFLLKSNKNHILILLLGIVTHWNILIIHKNLTDKLNIYFLDSKNSPEIFVCHYNSENFLMNKEKYLSKKLFKNEWQKKCTNDWYESMNKIIDIIFNVINKKLNLIYYVMENKIKVFLDSFNDKINIDLNDNNYLNIYNANKKENNEKIWEWITEEFHPAYFHDDIIEDLNKTKIIIKNKDILNNWSELMNLFLEEEEKKIDLIEDKKNIIKRYIKEINDFKNIFKN